MPKTILITGATSGFGAACAKKFAAEGWQLILTGRRTERLEQLQTDLGDAVCQSIPLDVRNREDGSVTAHCSKVRIGIFDE